ncbi:hypothetical protein [Roseofilum capinflatum]|uniref:Uncharacterized protein n=1 Tax=Roseofilum capinflatum BLCC-M114 TaxID=3022440 RepID=A0ABT7B3R7_9CYAN|nr:hypothetical protein [Roseofilum capinflatum]MDJ1173756.1 hypothetical protein [Roseofilum capinflatum BLCC-M114]
MTSPDTQIELDPQFQAQVLRYHRLLVGGRWFVVVLWWLVLGFPSLWVMRSPLSLLFDHFTWSGLYYSLYFHPLAAIGFSSSMGLTTAVLVWQSRNILVGFPHPYQKGLERKVCRIRQQGESHPLWHWVIAGQRNKE